MATKAEQFRSEEERLARAKKKVAAAKPKKKAKPAVARSEKTRLEPKPARRRAAR